LNNTNRLWKVLATLLVVFVGKLFLGRGRRREALVPDTAQMASRTAR
jgi:hypothetical protein